MTTRGLLSRLGGEPPASELDAIVAHLRALLGTWVGDAPATASFGVLPFVDIAHALPGAAQEMARSIRTAILEYEPRLSEVTVRHVPSEGLVLRFEIVGVQRGGRPVRLDTRFRVGGKVEVRT